MLVVEICFILHDDVYLKWQSRILIASFDRARTSAEKQLVPAGATTSMLALPANASNSTLISPLSPTFVQSPDRRNSLTKRSELYSFPHANLSTSLTKAACWVNHSCSLEVTFNQKDSLESHDTSSPSDGAGGKAQNADITTLSERIRSNQTCHSIPLGSRSGTQSLPPSTVTFKGCKSHSSPACIHSSRTHMEVDHFKPGSSDMPQRASFTRVRQIAKVLLAG